MYGFRMEEGLELALASFLMVLACSGAGIEDTPEFNVDCELGACVDCSRAVKPPAFCFNVDLNDEGTDSAALDLLFLSSTPPIRAWLFTPISSLLSVTNSLSTTAGICSLAAYSTSGVFVSPISCLRGAKWAIV